jgi:hypothetical protein
MRNGAVVANESQLGRSRNDAAITRPLLLKELESRGVRRRGVALNLYELGANEKVVQRILRHAKPHVTKERCIKDFDPAVLAAMKSLETALDDFHKCCSAGALS